MTNIHSSFTPEKTSKKLEKYWHTQQTISGNRWYTW